MKKVLIAVILCIFVAAMFTACGSEKTETGGEGCSAVTENIIATFMELTKVPRPSHHEEKISNYLLGWAQGKGLDAVQDDYYNLIIDVPATEGMEEKPLVCLQCHMDMVFAQKEGAGLDPLTTEIVVKNDGKYLTSDGNTSLGADNGIGLAVAMRIAEGEVGHGPLRLIITTNEEDGATGAFNISPDCVKDVSYMINIDHDGEGDACLSSAAGIRQVFSLDVSAEKPEGESAIEISIKGLTGGHSGLEIDRGRLNGLIGLANIIENLEKNGIEYELASFSGGSAMNAIPAAATAVICVGGGDVDKAVDILNTESEKYREDYSETDPDMTVTVEKTDLPDKVLSKEDKESIAGLLTGIRDGVYTMMEDFDGVVESSSNLGLLKADGDGVEAVAMVRSASPEKLDFLVGEQAELSESLGFSLESQKCTDAWPYKKDNPLFDLANDSYKSIFGKELGIDITHGGLECGTFAVYNPDINMISVGPEVIDSHTINERVEIESIEILWRLIQKVLEDIE